VGLSRTHLMPRSDHVRDSRLFIVAVEGQRTEVGYFALFGGSRVKVHVLPSEDNRSAPLHVLQRVYEFRRGFDFADEDECWLALDRDKWPPAALKKVSKTAREDRISIAISNPCFEVWLILHFVDHDRAQRTAQQTKRYLSTVLGGYNSSNLQRERFESRNIAMAVKRAQEMDSDKAAPWPPNPGTRIYLLVARLLERGAFISE